ncbi:MAG: molybdenum cofactor biosynthesis protein MoaE [Candidatus Caldarchaeum sp.]|uniref:Molybdenum cofactor biosynthesis protein MoaE n=1 Tax=Caldiarchaeum subterraneum TaxID=311458 RepID=A0A7C4I1Q7_CALS0
MRKDYWLDVCRCVMDIPESGVYGKGELDFMRLFQGVVARVSDGSCGAAAFFMGIVKRRGRGEVGVEKLFMESYEEHANKALKRICDEVMAEYRLKFVGIWHLVGMLEVGEPVVLVAAAGENRDEVFRGLRTAVERYKREPALFKKEVYIDGTEKWLEGA